MSERPRTMAAERLADYRQRAACAEYSAEHRLITELDAECAAHDSSEQELSKAKLNSICDVCSGTGKVPNPEGCICGGSGLACDAVIHMREQLYDYAKKLDSNEQTIRELRERLAATTSHFDNAFGAQMHSQIGLIERDSAQKQEVRELRIQLERERELSDQLVGVLRRTEGALYECGCESCEATLQKLCAVLTQHAAMRKSE